MDQRDQHPLTPGAATPGNGNIPSPTTAGGPLPRSGSKRALWLGLLAVVAIAVILLVARPRGGGPAAGTVVEAALTLVTSDRADLACASSRNVDAYSCAFGDDGAARPTEEKRALRPYMTVDRHLYLIPGLFFESNLERRYNAEPPQGRPRDQLRRFTAHCKLKVAGHLEGFKVRWTPTDKWSEPQNAEVATVVGCQVEGQQPAAPPSPAGH